MKKNGLLIFGMFLFIIGYIISFTFSALAVWADLEGMSFWGNPEVVSFDPTIEGSFKFAQLDCPIMMTPSETLDVTTIIQNTKKFDASEVLQVNISLPGEDQDLVREYTDISLDAKGNEAITWQVSQKNVTGRNYIFIRAYLLTRDGQPPYETNHCGIRIVNTPNLKGNQIELAALGISSLIMVLGIISWHRGSSISMRRFNKTLKLLVAMGLLVTISSLSNYTGIWLISALLLILSLLLVLSVVESVLLRS